MWGDGNTGWRGGGSEVDKWTDSKLQIDFLGAYWPVECEVEISAAKQAMK
jgi:hypothetical protein